MKLISATPSPYARKVRIALAEKGIDFDLITEVPWNENTSTPSYNPLEKLPVLILEDGATVYDSAFILEYLETIHPVPPLFPADPMQRLAARRLEVLADGICDAIVLTFFERLREPAHQSAPWIARQIRKIEGGMRELARLVPESGYCAGDRFGLGDIAVVTALDYSAVRFEEFDWPRLYPGLVTWRDALRDRPSIADTMPFPQLIDSGVV